MSPAPVRSRINGSATTLRSPARLHPFSGCRARPPPMPAPTSSPRPTVSARSRPPRPLSPSTPRSRSPHSRVTPQRLPATARVSRSRRPPQAPSATNGGATASVCPGPRLQRSRSILSPLLLTRLIPFWCLPPRVVWKAPRPNCSRQSVPATVPTITQQPRGATINAGSMLILKCRGNWRSGADLPVECQRRDPPWRHLAHARAHQRPSRRFRSLYRHRFNLARPRHE